MGKLNPNAKWKQFLSEEEAVELEALENSVGMYEECLKETRAAIRVLRRKHSWKLRKKNPYQGGSRENSSS